MFSCRRKTTAAATRLFVEKLQFPLYIKCRFSMRERHFVLRKVIFHYHFLTRSKNRINKIRGQHSVLNTKEKKRSKHYLCLFAMREKEKNKQEYVGNTRDGGRRGEGRDEILRLRYTNGIFLLFDLNPICIRARLRNRYIYI